MGVKRLTANTTDIIYNMQNNYNDGKAIENTTNSPTLSLQDTDSLNLEGNNSE